jgi:type II secretory pathway pseudopilin PulG
MRVPELHRHGKASQRGAALMIIIVILVVAIVAGLVGALSLSALNSARQEKTSAALAQAKDALLGRAVSNDNMPGSLPCPDQMTTIVGTNVPDDGIADLLVGNDCPSYIGRLPWKTLGLSDLRDGSGERLWYALSPAFRDDNSARPLNSNTKGTLNITGTQTASNVIAIVFAPGNILSTPSQSRSATQTAACTTTGTTVAASLCATNYLEGSNKNLSSAASPNTNYISADASNTFNDQLLYIATKDLMPMVEKRVAGVVKQALNDYYWDNGYYPWADNIGSSATYDSNYGLNRGWLPDNASSSSGSWHPDPPNWRAGSLPSPPQWFFDNQWYALIYYSVAKSYTSYPNDCTSCLSSTLYVDGNIGVHVLFFMPGTPIPANLVPGPNRAINNLSDYLEAQPTVDQNNDDADDRYVTPTSQDVDRDRLYWLPGANWKP